MASLTYNTVPTSGADEEAQSLLTAKRPKPRRRVAAAALVAVCFALGTTVAYVAPSKSSASTDLASSQDCDGSSCSPLGVAKAWKAYSGGAYAADCANSLAIALGEGIIPAQPLNYVCDPAIPDCQQTGKGCLGLPRDAWCWATPPCTQSGSSWDCEGKTPLSIEEFMLDTRLFDINMKPYDGQNTLGPWQTMTTVTDTNDINVRVREAVDYVRSNCNPNCPTPRENAQCENPFEDPRNEYCKQDGDCPVTVIFDSPNLNWCGCATTPWADPNKQTMGYSGRCSQGAGDYYTKYKALATQICNRA